MLTPSNFEAKITHLSNIRNGLQHYKIDKYEPDAWKNDIGQVLHYILKFEEANNNLFNIQARVSVERWQQIKNYRMIFEGYWEATRSKAQEENDGIYIECPECNLDDVTCLQGNGTAYCNFCKDIFHIQQCGYCGLDKSLDAFSEAEDGNKVDICNECFDLKVNED